MDRVKEIFASLFVGIIFGGISYYYFTEDGVYLEDYKTTLSGVWIVFAGWIPMMMLTLSILISISDRVLIRILSKTGHLQSLINNVTLCTIFILLTVVLLFLHSASSSSWLYTLMCTATVVTTVTYFCCIFYSIMLIGKNLPKADKADTSRKKDIAGNPI